MEEDVVVVAFDGSWSFGCGGIRWCSVVVVVAFGGGGGILWWWWCGGGIALWWLVACCSNCNQEFILP